jgi:hypothetical protein
MSKKIPARCARTYSRNLHRAETQAMIDEQLREAEALAAPWAEDQAETSPLASLMQPSNDDGSPRTPQAATKPQEPAVLEFGPPTPAVLPPTLAAKIVVDASTPADASAPSLPLQGGSSTPEAAPAVQQRKVGVLDPDQLAASTVVTTHRPIDPPAADATKMSLIDRLFSKLGRMIGR